MVQVRSSIPSSSWRFYDQNIKASIKIFGIVLEFTLEDADASTLTEIQNRVEVYSSKGSVRKHQDETKIEFMVPVNSLRDS